MGVDRMETQASVKEEASNYKSLKVEDSFHDLSVLDFNDSKKVGQLEESISAILKTITTNAKQLGEYLIEQDNVVQNICSSFTKILAILDLSMTLPKEAIIWTETVKDTFLNSQGHLIIVKEDGEVESKSLYNYPPKIVLIVVCAALPKLKEAVDRFVTEVGSRLNLFEKINSEFSSFLRTMDVSKEKELDNTAEYFEKGVGKGLTSKKG